jgi:2-oxo-3-hexenedioate decarboxylase
MTPREAAAALFAVRTEGRTVDPFTDDRPDLDETWAYDVQDLDQQQRLDAGEVAFGAKLGLTSVAKQQRMSVDRPIVGFLTEPMLRDADTLADDLVRWVQPRIEPEIAFVTGRALSGPLSREEAADAVESVTIAAEILDSRYTGYRFRLADVVADNTSAAGLLLGADRHRLADLPELAELSCTVEVDGEVTHRATGAAILGDPLLALVLLTEHLGRRGETLPAGSVVLAGALTDAVPLEAGKRYRLEVVGLGVIETSA